MAYTIMTSSAIASSLKTMLSSNDQLAETQARLSSGLNVSDAKDNPGYWSVSNALTSDESILTSVGDALNLSQSTIDTAYAATETVIEQLSSLRSALVTANDDSIDRTQIGVSVKSAKDAIQLAVSTAVFGGTNWLQNDDAILSGANSIVTSFQRTQSGSVKLATQGIPASDTVLIDSYDASRGLFTQSVDANALNPDGTGAVRNYYLLDVGSDLPSGGTEIAVTEATTPSEITDMISVVEAMLNRMTTISSRLGDMQNRVESQSAFAKALTDTLSTSISRLVDADMEEVSARLTASKTQASLASQVVSMANTNAQKLLLLFN